MLLPRIMITLKYWNQLTYSNHHLLLRFKCLVVSYLKVILKSSIYFLKRLIYIYSSILDYLGSSWHNRLNLVFIVLSCILNSLVFNLVENLEELHQLVMNGLACGKIFSPCFFAHYCKTLYTLHFKF